MFSSPHSARNRTFLLLETRAPIPVAHMRPGCGLPHAGPPSALRGGRSVQSGTHCIPGPPGRFFGLPILRPPRKKIRISTQRSLHRSPLRKKVGFLGLFERGRLKKESLRPAMNGELNGTRARSYRTRASEIDRPFEGASIKTIPAALASAPLCGAGEGRRGAGHATAPWTAAPVSEPGGKELAAREMRPAVGKRNTQGLLPAISFFADRSLSLCRPDCP